MGLAEPKRKQRIGPDPRNKAWADDKSKFGLKMLEKFGWSEGKGLGVNQDGITQHVSVRLKEDNLGVGADRRTVDNWLDNNSAFDQLLQSLATTTGGDSTTVTETREETKAEVEAPKAPAFGRFHRKKFLRNKTVSNYDSADLSRILGKKADSATPTPPPEREPTPEVTPSLTSIPGTTTLTVVSTSNVRDYFEQKMATIGLSSSGASAPKEAGGDWGDEDERPSFGGLGLGFGGARLGSAGAGEETIREVEVAVAVKVTEQKVEEVVRDESDGVEKKSQKEKKEKKEKKKERKEKKRKAEVVDESRDEEASAGEEKKSKKKKKDKQKKKSNESKSDFSDDAPTTNASTAEDGDKPKKSKKDKKKKRKEESAAEESILHTDASAKKRKRDSDGAAAEEEKEGAKKKEKKKKRKDVEGGSEEIKKDKKKRKQSD
ncbi:PIN2/TERF1-interacting telomerase inhibitor 1 [Rhizophlyctis rosea]|uniref:PIN2/TERF1-interacting telomerase inhibitor 1 n=1 Tax=Rhizophlyctis rosea TaxID=64517 RepID=A0AAD5SH04_9FUNG|nr:PIN2/TERF1-interacting telomerase inhibitor 1 [Rhizophlyctis rosea]